jgi:hypothetical protein
MNQSHMNVSTCHDGYPATGRQVFLPGTKRKGESTKWRECCVGSGIHPAASHVETVWFPLITYNKFYHIE